jgi:hypothetical protein
MHFGEKNSGKIIVKLFTNSILVFLRIFGCAKKKKNILFWRKIDFENAALNRRNSGTFTAKFLVLNLR